MSSGKFNFAEFFFSSLKSLYDSIKAVCLLSFASARCTCARNIYQCDDIAQRTMMRRLRRNGNFHNYCRVQANSNYDVQPAETWFSSLSSFSFEKKLLSTEDVERRIMEIVCAYFMLPSMNSLGLVAPALHWDKFRLMVIERHNMSIFESLSCQQIEIYCKEV